MSLSEDDVLSFEGKARLQWHPQVREDGRNVEYLLWGR